MQEDLLGEPILDERRVVVDEQDGVGEVPGKLVEAQRGAFPGQLPERPDALLLGVLQGRLDVPALADARIAPDVQAVVATVDDPGHPVDHGLLLLAIGGEMLTVGLFHRPLSLRRKPGKSENCSPSFRVSEGHHGWFEIKSSVFVLQPLIESSDLHLVDPGPAPVEVVNHRMVVVRQEPRA